MIMGHFATALVPYQKCRGNPKASFWLFLLAAQFLDFLMLGFMALGMETVTPENFFDSPACIRTCSTRTTLFLWRSGHWDSPW